MKFHYYDKIIQKFVTKHPCNFNQLFYMTWASHTSYTNLSIITFLYNQDSFSDVVREYRLNAVDIGTSVDKVLKYKKCKYMLPERYHIEVERLSKELKEEDILKIITARGLTWGVLITLLLQEHITIALDIAIAISRGENIRKYKALITANGVQLINTYQVAGNKPILVDKGIKLWNMHNEQFISQIEARLAKDYMTAINLYNNLQLHSFPMACFFVKTIL